MKFSKFKVLATLLVAISVHATDYNQGEPIEDLQLMSAYNTSARIDVRGSWDLYISGSFIYWRPTQEGLELGYTLSEDGSIQGSVINMDFDYKPGLKVEIGMNFDHDNWSTFAEYTWLSCENHKFKEKPADMYLLPNWAKYLFSEQWANAHWNLDLNILDIALTRAYYIGTKLTFKPHFGIRAACIDQAYKISYEDIIAEITDIQKYRSSSWLVGPRCGINTNWHLGEGVRIFSNLATSLTYQHFKVRRTKNLEAEVIEQDVRGKSSYIIPNLEIGLGVGWGTYFDNSNWHFDLTAGYDFQILWNQNQMAALKDTGTFHAVSDGTAGSLMFQGLTVKARFDF